MQTFVEELAFAEGPRWRDGRLWWSDMHAERVQSWSPEDGARTEAAVEHRPSGLGWLPDGRLLVVSMMDRTVLRREPDGDLVVHADLSLLVPRRLNDMVVDATGRAYVGNFGFDLEEGEPIADTVLAMIEPDGRARIVAEGLLFPNGMVITADQRTLIVAETFAARLSAFDIAADGSLSGRRVWAQLPEHSYPDGICLDLEGCVWVASTSGNACVRVQEGGALLERVEVGRSAFACAMGGPERRTLFICTAPDYFREPRRTERTGRIEGVRVAVPGV
ncbi:SMP-30/gluconolactonase/LRE family protein [Lichenicoccus sp.]|uniref:SMP-30/gluconolactonase/LRE family protein n=1 Tax=Lichenicoccus sp. TaxID=2781899 RepID=UPI003D0B673A